MAVSRHGAHLVQVTRLRFVNAYLVHEDDGLTVVDTTVPGGATAILAAAGELGAPVRRLTVTHAHTDHVGSVDALVERLGGEVEIAFPERDARIMAGDMSLDPAERGPDLRSLRLRGSFTEVKARPTRLLAPGDRLGSLEVVPAAGHTPGQVAFRDARDGTLLCADAYATLFEPVTSAKPTLRSPVPALATWNRELALESARALRSPEPTRLAPGHGRVVEDPAAVMDRALATAS